MLNQVPLIDFFSKELDAFHVNELEALSQRLRLTLCDNVRMAPSIIVRSELEFAGCANPRFAFRVYFKDSRSFVNVRRLREFSGRIHVYEELADEKDTYSELPGNAVAALLNSVKASCIADCLLEKPARFSDLVYHFIDAQLSRAYGESDPKLDYPDFRGIPYVRNISIAGGLCSHACCFMATALLHDHASGIHGLAEIMALASSPRRTRLEVAGLNDQQMNRYFNFVGLTLTNQAARANGAEKLHEFEAAVRSYIMSNMPVIAFLDLGRLMGFRSRRQATNPDVSRSIYAKNGLTLDESPSDFSPRASNRHAFLIIGCNKRSEQGKCNFVFNDPGAHPFMLATSEEIADAGPYTYPNAAVDQIDSCHFCPVTPAAVKLPLLDFQPVDIRTETDAFCLGLRSLSLQYRRKLRQGTNLTNAPISNDFRLTQLEQIASAVDPSAFANLGGKFQEKLDILAHGLASLAVELKTQYGWTNQHWVWLEFLHKPDGFEDEIWVWDAEVPPVESRFDECFVARITKYGGATWRELATDYDF